MTKQATFSNPFADVDISEVTIPGVESHNKVAVRVKDDAGDYHVAGILSKDYNLIKNSYAHETALDIFSRSPYKFTELFPDGHTDPHGKGSMYFDGKRYLHYFKSIDPIVEKNDLRLHLGALLKNSYDGGGKWAFEIYALNPFCTNQYHQRNALGFFEVRHTTNGTTHIDMEDTIRNLERGAQNIIAIAPRIIAMQDEPLQVEHITQAAKNKVVPASSWGSILSGIEGASVFALYQALTAYASHECNGLSSLNYGQLIGNHFLPITKQESQE